MRAPVIGVTGPARGGHSGWSLTWFALRRAGARPMRLRPPFRAQYIERLAGVVIGGGANIEPARYAATSSIEYLYDEARDEFEWQVLIDAAARGMPVLGICRGAQLINVFRGGTLWQNLVEDIPGLHLRRSVLARKPVTVEPNTLLASVMGVTTVTVNSLHRQGIKDLGRDLRVCARDSDGIVQAIEATGRVPFLLGVQWHPEYLPRPPHSRLFERLVLASCESRPTS
jgi:putative glutamine amidotransferase